MTIKGLVGTYQIIGKNQDESGVSYKGTLSLTLNESNQILANWIIDSDQKQTGIGFFKDNTLVINFQYTGEDFIIYKGVVVYKCITKDVLDGFWSEEMGDPNYLGTEQCFRVKNAILN